MLAPLRALQCRIVLKMEHSLIRLATWLQTIRDMLSVSVLPSSHVERASSTVMPWTTAVRMSVSNFQTLDLRLPVWRWSSLRRRRRRLMLTDVVRLRMWRSRLVANKMSFLLSESRVEIRRYVAISSPHRPISIPKKTSRTVAWCILSISLCRPKKRKDCADSS